MKRETMIDKMVQAIEAYRECYKDSPEHINLKNEMDYLLFQMEKKYGMAPPSVSEKDRQALMHVYMAGYTFHQWDEELAKDEKVQAAKKRRAEAAEYRKSKPLRQRLEERRNKDNKNE